MIFSKDKDTWIRNTFLICYLASIYLGFTEILYVGLLLSYLIISIGIYCLYQLRNNWPPLIKSFWGVLLLLVFYFVIGDKNIHIPYSGFTVSIYNDVVYPYVFIMSLFIVSFYLGREQVINEKQLLLFLFLITPFVILKYYQSFLLESQLYKGDVTIGDVTNNSGYLLVSLLPFLFLIKNRIIPIVLFGGIMYFVIFSGKRGAIILTLIFAIYYGYEYYLRKNFSILNVFLILILVYVAYYIIGYALFNNDFLYHRFEMTIEGNSSSRDIIVERIWKDIVGPNSTSFSLLFGGGMGRSIRSAGNWAHNDWLEFLSMSGVVGTLVYLFFYISILRAVVKYPKNLYMMIFVGCSLMLFVKSFFSMSLFMPGINIYPLMIIMGYAYGNIIPQTHRRLRLKSNS